MLENPVGDVYIEVDSGGIWLQAVVKLTVKPLLRGLAVQEKGPQLSVLGWTRDMLCVIHGHPPP